MGACTTKRASSPRKNTDPRDEVDGGWRPGERLIAGGAQGRGQYVGGAAAESDSDRERLHRQPTEHLLVRRCKETLESPVPEKCDAQKRPAMFRPIALLQEPLSPPERGNRN